MNAGELLPGERLDDLQIDGFRLIQKRGTFCFGTDSVLLADFAAPKKRDRAVDLGCGNGAIAILMAAHALELRVDGVELQGEIADMARRSVRVNALEDRVRVFTGDMRAAWTLLGREAYSLAVCNPPYGASGAGLASANESRRIARQADDLSPMEICASAERLLKYGGRFCVVYPAARAYEMMAAMDACRIAPKRVRTVHAAPDRAPKLILIEAVKGAGSALHWMTPLILRDADGGFSAEYRRIYRLTDGENLL